MRPTGTDEFDIPHVLKFSSRHIVVNHRVPQTSHASEVSGKGLHWYRYKEHFSCCEQLPQNTDQREWPPLATEVARSTIYGRQLCWTCWRPLQNNFKIRTKRRVSQPCNLSTHSILHTETSCCVPIVRRPSIPGPKHNSQAHRFRIPSTTVSPRLYIAPTLSRLEIKW